VHLQNSYTRLRGFVDALDATDEWDGSAHRLLLRRSHMRIGERFTEWLQKSRDPLGEHARTVQTAAMFELEHIDRMRAAGDEDILKVKMACQVQCVAGPACAWILPEPCCPCAFFGPSKRICGSCGGWSG
jgi:hypothetical protein